MQAGNCLPVHGISQLHLIYSMDTRVGVDGMNFVFFWKYGKQFTNRKNSGHYMTYRV